MNVTVYITSEIRHSKYLYFGLKSLLKKNYISKLKLIPEKYYINDRVLINESEIKRVNRPYPFSIKVVITNSGNKKIIAFDLVCFETLKANIRSLIC